MDQHPLKLLPILLSPIIVKIRGSALLFSPAKASPNINDVEPLIVKFAEKNKQTKKTLY